MNQQRAKQELERLFERKKDRQRIYEKAKKERGIKTEWAKGIMSQIDYEDLIDDERIKQIEEELKQEIEKQEGVKQFLYEREKAMVISEARIVELDKKTEELKQSVKKTDTELKKLI